MRLVLQSSSQSVTIQAEGETLEQIPSVGKTGTMLADIPQSVSIIGHELSESQGNLELADTVHNASGVIQGGSDGLDLSTDSRFAGLKRGSTTMGFRMATNAMEFRTR